MHIKKVIIKGFKSYSSQSDFDTFHPRTNVIVGKNGAGKSNFIDAIRFVLSTDKYRKLRSEDRKALLHHGTKDTVLSGYVEIHFDNSDKRLPVDSTEVILRRNIGLKKDEYFLNNKHVSAEDVMNLFESAGFSRSNPYYIVMQGQVQALAKMKASERLELLKEVAGTNVYEERRAESLKILQDTESRKKKIEEVLAYIEERLSELESEKNELKEYQQLDRDRRALEYSIYESEKRACDEQLAELEESRDTDANKVTESHQEVLDSHDAVKATEKELKALLADQSRATADKDLYQGEKQEYIKAKARLELELRDCQEIIAAHENRRKDISNELKDVQKSVKKTNSDLDKARPKYQDAVKEEADLKENLSSKERRVQELYAKQGRNAQFSSKKARDDWIKKEVKELEAAVNTKKKQLEAVQKELEEIDERLGKSKSKSDDRSKGLQERKEALDKLNDEYNDLKNKRDEFANRRKDLWRQEAESETETLRIRTEMLKVERQLQSTVSKEVNQGLATIRRIAGEQKVSGVYGPMIELFDVEEEYMAAVEVTAGNSLFYVVVDTDKTATTLLDELNKERAGRVTFIPLNQLATKEPKHAASSSASPLTDVLTYDKKTYEKAFNQIFGKTLLCQTLEVGAQISKSHNMNCVTPQGDQINTKGALSGGFYDVRVSRLKAMKTIKEYREKLRAITDQSKKQKKQIADCDQRINQILGEMQKIDTERAKQHEAYETFDVKARSSAKKMLEDQEKLEQRQREYNEQQNSITQLEESIKALRAEMGTELLDKLTAAEQKQLRELNDEITKLNEELIKASQQRAQLEGQKNELENLLQNLLLKRQEELEGVLNSLEISEEQTRLKRIQSDLDGVNHSLTDINTRQSEFESKIEENNKSINKLKNRIEDLKKNENEAQKRLQNESKNMERLLNKRSMLLQKREESLKKIRDIGSLPTEALEKFRELDLKDMHAQLRDTKNNLKKYSSVNKKALDQYVNFTEQHEDLSNRKNELDASKGAIDELVEELDHKKDEAIERTFKGVAKFFSEVFSELTGGGRANLIMQKPKGEKELEGPERIRSYRGVEVQVAFNPNAPEYQNMSQLSGGQQSLVALALIFAIQRCDPAPFYVFDEIDPALDDNHRHAVAAMIKKQSKVIQFITTSHRPELVSNAHKCYKITFTNRVSNIVSVGQDEALELIKEVEEEEDAQQERSRSVNVSRSSRNKSVEAAQSEEEEAEGGEASDE
eukprot:TRINITY_DN3656_c0_g1_i1.p1 TRINITY_DN3656_c0_g1~~TRINITY_DN3656_c0_g1_i1.p1  ORF type:complete len:1231 (-),score=557.87 TRINITY_DN3656_c0_g1_i1:31-3723(-)